MLLSQCAGSREQRPQREYRGDAERATTTVGEIERATEEGGGEPYKPYMSHIYQLVGLKSSSFNYTVSISVPQLVRSAVAT